MILYDFFKSYNQIIFIINFIFFVFSSCLIFVKKIATLNANNVLNIILIKIKIIWLIYFLFQKCQYLTTVQKKHRTFIHHYYSTHLQSVLLHYVQKHIKPNVSLNINCISFTYLFRLTSSFLAVKSLKLKFSLIPDISIKIIKIKYVNKLNF